MCQDTNVLRNILKRDKFRDGDDYFAEIVINSAASMELKEPWNKAHKKLRALATEVLKRQLWLKDHPPAPTHYDCLCPICNCLLTLPVGTEEPECCAACQVKKEIKRDSQRAARGNLPPRQDRISRKAGTFLGKILAVFRFRG